MARNSGPSRLGVIHLEPARVLAGTIRGTLSSIDDYATVTLRLDPGDAVMDILVNGIDRLQYLSSSPFVTANPRLEWGWAAPPNSSGNEGRYALVQMNTIPEPSTYALLALGALTIFSAMRRRRANS